MVMPEVHIHAFAVSHDRYTIIVVCALLIIAKEGRARDTVLQVPFHPRLCKLHLLKRKVFQYVLSFRGNVMGVGLGPSLQFLSLPSDSQ